MCKMSIKTPWKMCNQIYIIYFIPMDKTCNPEQLYERKFPKNELPLKKCAECLFNVLCLDYSTYDEDEDHRESKKDCEG